MIGIIIMPCHHGLMAFIISNVIATALAGDRFAATRGNFGEYGDSGADLGASLRLDADGPQQERRKMP
jgi:hypothetical protein